MAVNKTTEFGTYHIADNPQAFQPMRTNNFRFLVYGLDRLLVVGGDEDDGVPEGDLLVDGKRAGRWTDRSGDKTNSSFFSL